MKTTVRALAAMALLPLATLPQPAPVVAQQAPAAVVYSHLTFYTEQGPMADGTWTHDGAAACGADFPMGSVLELPDGSIVVCEDTGYLARNQVDVWRASLAEGWDWTHSWGDYGDVIVLAWGGS